MTEEQDHVIVGVLGKTRGVRGEINVTALTDFPERFAQLAEILIENRGRWESWVLESAQVISGRPVLKLKGIDSKEEAARMTNRRLAIKRSQVLKLPEDTYYVFDLIGLEVIGHDLQDVIGEIVDVQRYPANDAYVIRKADGSRVSIPAVAKYVLEVDIESKRMIIDTAGLIDGG